MTDSQIFRAAKSICAVYNNWPMDDQEKKIFPDSSKNDQALTKESDTIFKAFKTQFLSILTEGVKSSLLKFKVAAKS